MMADEDETFPPEIQKSPSEFAFQEILSLKTSTVQEQPQYPKIRSNLLAVANLYGFVFVGTPDGVKVYLSSKLLEAGKLQKDHVDDVVTIIYLRNAPNWIAVNSDNLTLAVCCQSDKGPQMLFFDVRNIANKSKSTKTPFCSSVLSKAAGSYVTSLQWNPSREWPSLLAVCLSTGSFHMLSVEDTVKEVGIRPDDFGATAVCWSPKGKQLVIGKKDGTLHQFTQKLEVRRSISVATVIDRPVRACDILWLSTYHFAAAYVATDAEDDNLTQPNLFLAHLPSKNEQRNIIWRNYEDPCFGMNETQDPRYMMTFIDQWEMFVALSSNSTDSAVIAKNKETHAWEIWTLEDSGRAGLPMSEFTQDDSAPVGVAIITTATDRVRVDDARECGPMPVLVMLTNDGILCCFHMINLIDQYPDLVHPPVEVEFAGERIASGDRSAKISDEPAKEHPMPNMKQRLKAKPSIVATSTPKAGANLPQNLVDPSHLQSQSVAPAKPSFSTSTPATRLPPFSIAEGPSIIQDVPTPQIKHALTRELPLNNAPFIAARKPELDESTNSVFNSVSIASSESVFAAQNSPARDVHALSGESTSKQGPIKAKLAPQKSVWSTSTVKPSVPSSPAFISDRANFNTDSANATLQKTQAVHASPATRPAKMGPAETGSFTKKREASTSEAAPLRRKSDTGKEVVSDSRSLSAETINEIASFEEELKQVLALSEDVKKTGQKLGSEEEKVEMRRDAANLSKFSKAVAKTTQELYAEIQDTSVVVQEAISVSEGVQRKQTHANNRSYRSMLYNRPLAPSQQEKLKGIRGLHQYIRNCIRDTNAALDEQWEETYNRRKGLNRKMYTKNKRLKTGDWESAYQVLVNNTKILHEQEMKLLLLGQQLDRLRLDEAGFSQGHQSSGGGSLLRGNVLAYRGRGLQLTDDLFSPTELPSLTPEAGGVHDTFKRQSMEKISNKKQAQLGQMLANRKVTPVRSSEGSRMITLPASPVNAKRLPAAADAQEPVSNTETASHGSRSSSSVSDEQDGLRIGRAPSPPLSIHKVSDPGGFTGTPVFSEFKPQKLQFGTPAQKGKSGESVEAAFAKQSGPSQVQEMASIIPQGSATLAYGAPKSVAPISKPRNLPSIAAENYAEAASNLNNPPQVVNIQQLQTPAPKGQPLPDKFVPKSDIPVGAAEVVQAVLNTVKAEKQQQPDEPRLVHTQVSPSSSTLQPPISSLGLRSGNSDPISGIKSGDKPKVGSSTSFGIPGAGFGFSIGDGVLNLGTDAGNPPKQLLPNPPVSQSFPAAESNAEQVKVSLTPATTKVQPSTQVSVSSSNPTLDNVVSSSSGKTALREVKSSKPQSSIFGSLGQRSASLPGSLTAATGRGFGSLAQSSAMPDSSLFNPASLRKSEVVTADITVTSAGGAFTVSSGDSAFAITASTARPHGLFGTSVASTSSGATNVNSGAGVFGTGSTQSSSSFETLIPSTSVSASGSHFPATRSSGLFGTPVSITTPSTSGDNVTGAGAIISQSTSLSSASVVVSSSSVPSLPASGFQKTSTLSTGLFSNLPAVTTSASTSGSNVFGISTSTQSSTLFGNPTTQTSNLFGTPITVSGTSSGSVFGASITTSQSSSPFGAAVSVSTGSSLFGAAATSSGGLFGTASKSNVGLFGSIPASGSVFGVAPSTTSSLFGAQTTTCESVFSAITPSSSSQSTASIFGSKVAAPAFGQSPSFGQTSSAFGQTPLGAVSQTSSVFGQTALESTSQSSSPFGQNPFGSTRQSAVGFGGAGGFFSGLGGKPAADAANKNPFAVAESLKQQENAGFGMFPNSGASSFGSSTFGQTPQKPSGFGMSTGGVATAGFGFNKPQQAGGFGAPPAFGSPPAFGASANLGNTFGGGFGSKFASSTTVFGQSEASSGFATFAKTETPGFGNLAQQSGGGFGSFGSQPVQQQQSPFQGGFNAGNQKSPSFSGWR